jgi:hypothetical protein
MALAVARLVTSVLPRVRIEEIEGVGHMAPVTHPDTVNPLIERFLEAPRDSRHLAVGTLSTSPKTGSATYLQQDRVFRPNARTHNGNPGFMYTCNQFVGMEGLGEDEGWLRSRLSLRTPARGPCRTHFRCHVQQRRRRRRKTARAATGLGRWRRCHS